MNKGEMLRGPHMMVAAVIVFLMMLTAACQPSATPTPVPAAPTKAPAAATTAPAAATAAPAAATKPPAAATTAPAAATKPPAAATTAPAAAAKPVRGGILRETLSTEPDTLDPHLTSGGANRGTVQNLFDNLVAHNQQLQATKNGLATDWTPSSDGMSIMVTLRKGVKFHDGADFNAAAVKFNIERLQDPKLKSPQGGYVEPIASVQIVDDFTVKFNLKRPSPALMETFGLLAGLTVSPAAVQKYGDQFGLHPVGTGPFQFVSWDRGGHVVFKRFDGYWRKDQDGNQLPYLDGVDFAIVPDASAAFANLRSGSVDMYRDMAYRDVETLKQNPNLTYTEQPYAIVWGVYINVAKPPFDNKALRQAIAYAVDRDAIVKAVYGGGAVAVANYLDPLSWAYDANYKYPYLGPDVAKAKAKLAEAGYPQGLKFDFVGADRREDTLIAETIQQSLAKVGIDMQLNLTTSAKRLELMNAHEYQVGWSGYSNYADPELSLTNRFHSAAGTRNRGNYKSPQVDALLEKAGSIYDQAQRTALYRQAGEIIMDDLSFIPMDEYKLVFGMSKKVKNFVQFYDAVERLVEVWLEK